MTTAVQLAQSVAPGVSLGFKNRIINGGMTIDQRNAGASVTPTNGQYTIDRWAAYLSQSSKFSVQQNAGSVAPPTGFANYLGATSLSAYSVGASDYFNLSQNIEGFNVSDLGWGTANAQSVTVSFWVRSSLTGTFGGAIFNGGSNYSYPFSYVINAANTWELKSINISGPTSGTWATNNGTGLVIRFGLGVGSTYSGPAGAWASTIYVSATGATSVVGTNGATFYITGVQLEVGTAATNFEFRDYGRELIMCQRYYETLIPTTSNLALMLFNYSPAGNYWGFWDMKVEKRTTATVALTASGSWVNATPTIYPGITTVSFQYNAGTQAYLSGTSGTPALYASAEL